MNNGCDFFKMREGQCDFFKMREGQCDFFKMREGQYGPYFTPHIDEEGNLTWSNNAELPNPDPVDIKGPKGNPGDDGISPVVTITAIAGGHRVTITDATHPQGQSFDVMDGEGGSTLTQTAITLLQTILEAAIYTSDQSDNIDALIAELRGGSAGIVITYSGTTATITGLASTSISYSGTTATVGGN